jgi:hypothetical protein
MTRNILLILVDALVVVVALVVWAVRRMRA